MTRFTKTANFIFRGTIVAALGATVMQLVTGGAFAANLLDETLHLPVSGLMGMGNITAIAVLAAVLFSIIAHKSTSTASTIVRTMALGGTAALTLLGTSFFSYADLIFRSMNGAATAAELADAQPVFEVFQSAGVAQGDMAAAFATCGTVVTFIAAAVLAVLTITSIVSVVKTVRTQTERPEMVFAAA